MVTEEGRAGASSTFLVLLPVILQWPQTCTPHSQQQCWRSSEPPSLASSLAAFCYYEAWASAERRMSHFPPPQQAITFISLSYIKSQSLFQGRSGKNNFPQWHFNTSDRWSAGKLYTGFLRNFTTHAGTPSAFLSSTLLPPLSLSYMHT